MRFNIAAIGLALLAGVWAQTELPTLADRNALLSFTDQNPNSYTAPYENGYAVFLSGKPIAIADAGLANELRPDLGALAKTPKRRAVTSSGSSGVATNPSSVFCRPKTCRNTANCPSGCRT
ncbi:Nascent polypeptide-associated complex subunit beta [Sphaceloma murrayae]|uniref:Nascent polypeptide-associated complex subunit beta n=1 Tax=Sphaceloma murrayae TaxID=2082308 RepID=A0A2K1QYW2_9PEZI|nr:Nascent polypeptide-associated complex subunit beta [Sphaceloma murrayae]